MYNSFLLTIDELMMFGTKGYRHTQRASFRSKWQLLLIAMVGYTVNHLISALINTAILGSEYDYIRPRCEEGWFGDQGAETYMIYNLNARNNTVPMWNNRVYMKRWITTRASPVYQRFLPPDDINNFTNLQYDALCVRSFYDCFTPYKLEMEIPVNSTYFKIVVHEDRNTETESFPGGGEHDIVGKIPNLTAVSTLYHMLGSSVDKELGGGRHAFVRYKSFEQQMLNSGHIRTVGHADYIETFNDKRLLDAEKNEKIICTL
ncbi:hypothetical protein BC940DRAFT_363745 [Gongronella butleri]|nr:hypothetical protein BC940DRAFT_363745 [Gongronella butleri]